MTFCQPRHAEVTLSGYGKEAYTEGMTFCQPRHAEVTLSGYGKEAFVWTK